MQKSHVDIIMYLFCLNENHCTKKIIVIKKNNFTIRIAGKVPQYIDASMNRATPSKQPQPECTWITRDKILRKVILTSHPNQKSS